MWMIDVEEFLTLRDLFNKELSISEIARQTGHSRVTVRKHLNSQIPPLPKKRSRKPSKLDGHREYIIDRLKEFPLSASRIYREILERGFTGKYTISCMKSDPISEFQRYTATRPNQVFRLRLIGLNAVTSRSMGRKGNSTVFHGSRLFANEICRINSANRCLYPYPMPH
jgi:hypothetical protein